MTPSCPLRLRTATGQTGWGVQTVCCRGRNLSRSHRHAQRPPVQEVRLRELSGHRFSGFGPVTWSANRSAGSGASLALCTRGPWVKHTEGGASISMRCPRAAVTFQETSRRPDVFRAASCSRRRKRPRRACSVLTGLMRVPDTEISCRASLVAPSVLHKKRPVSWPLTKQALRNRTAGAAPRQRATQSLPVVAGTHLPRMRSTKQVQWCFAVRCIACEGLDVSSKRFCPCDSGPAVSHATDISDIPFLFTLLSLRPSFVTYRLVSPFRCARHPGTYVASASACHFDGWCSRTVTFSP